MEFEIFIKDNAFLPISVDIKTGTAVVFINTDAVKHEIHCKGHANFPLLSISAGEFQHYVFSLPGRYEISGNGIGDMKCVVEATEIDRENIPKRNYFPTSKERKLMEGQLGGVKSALMGEPWESTLPAIENSISVHDDQISGIRQIDEYRTKRVSKSSAYGRPFKPSVSSQSDNSDTDSGEEGNIAQQRSRVKASTVKYNKTANSSTHNKEITRNPQQSFKETPSMVTTATASSPAYNNNLPPAGSTIAKTSAHPPSTPPRISSRSTAPIAHAPSLRTKLVMIEDYAFSVSTMDVVVGQWIEFRLAEDVPAHAEHEICGISTVKQLCFESPLLQQEECTSYTYCPAHPGEIAVSCKIYPEMSCAIVVHPQTVRLDATPPVSPDRVSAAERRRDGTYNPRVAFQSAEKSADRHSRSHVSADVSLGGMMDVASPPPAHLQSPISPTSPAYQDVGEAVLQFDASKVPSPHRGYGSESQSSFYDSDDIFSDFEPAAKLQHQFEDAVEESDARNSRSLLEEVRLGLKNPGYADNIINTRAPAYSATASTSSIATTSNASTNGVRKNTPYVASHVIDQIVSIEEFSFRPHQIQVRCGEWVRFRRPAALVSASLVCEGEFVASEVNWPVEGDYLCLDHCFTKPGVFDVCNVIYTFCKCEVLVMLHNPPAVLGGNVRKGATPKLHGSFSAAPAKPVFHFPITDEEKQGLKNTLTATTSTTVNVTTTTTVICSSSSPTNIATLAHPTSATMSQVHTDSSDSDDTELVQNPHDKQTVKKKGPTESTPLSKPVPLYGSFMNLSGGTGLQNATQSNNDNPSGLPRVAVDSSLETYINKFVSKLHPLDEVSEESEADNDGAEPDAAALKRRKKNQKKKEKLKLKQKQKRQAELELQATAETSEPMDVVEDETTEHYFVNHNADLATDATELAHSTLQVNTVFPNSVRAAVAADRSPEAVIDRYLKDAGVSRSRIQAQIDWGEEIELDDDLDEKTTSAYSGSASQGADGNISAEANAAEEAVVMKKDSVSGSGKADGATVTAFVIQEQQETSSAVDESTTSAPVAAGKKKKNRSKAKRTGSFAQQEDAVQETVSVDKTQSERTEELGAVNGVTLAQSETVPVLALTATGNDSSPAQLLPPQPVAAAPSTPPSTPRQNQDPLHSHADTYAADVVNAFAENGVQSTTAGAPNAVLSPESFVTPTKTRKPRKEKARTPAAAAPTATLDSVIIAAEATTAIGANGSARTSASSPQLNEKMSPAAFASPSAESSTTPSTGDHMSRSSQLLRSALRIAPQYPQRDSPVPSVLFPEASDITVGQSSADVVTGVQLVGMVDTESINTGMVEDSAGEAGQDVLLSACYAFEAQMEEFFLSRFDNVMDKLRRGQPDRLPSGKEVEIHYLEEQRETVIARGKHNPVKVTDSVHTAKNKDTAAPKKTKSKRK